MADLNGRVQYFLGANSANGFHSLYEEWVDEAAIQAYYVIKGGAGCGKSTLMGRVARRMEEAGYSVEYIRCSGDPASLDGIAVPEKGAAAVDGTAPHRIDPSYTGATGHYIDLGAAYDRKALFPLRNDLIHAARSYQSCYTQAYSMICASEETRRRGWSPFQSEDIQSRAADLAEELLTPFRRTAQNNRGRRMRRFLKGVTCQGSILLEDTLSALCEDCRWISDPYGLGPVLLAHLERGFLAAGYDVISCPDPVAPTQLSQLLIPACSLAFVSEGGKQTDQYSIFTEDLIKPALLEQTRAGLTEADARAQDLMRRGISWLAEAKERHDILEELYHPHVDFSLVDRLADETAEEILALPDCRG